VYADFQNLDDANRLRLTCAGTVQDLQRQEIQLPPIFALRNRLTFLVTTQVG
jgi:hypothetical protein